MPALTCVCAPGPGAALQHQQAYSPEAESSVPVAEVCRAGCEYQHKTTAQQPAHSCPSLSGYLLASS